MPQVKFLSQMSPLLHKTSPGDPQLASELTRQYILQVHRVQPSELRDALLAELKAKTTKPDKPSREPLKPGRCATSAPPFARHGGKTSCSCSLSRPLGGHFAQHRTRNGEHSSGPSSRNSGCGCTCNLGTWHRGSWCRSRCRAWCVCRRWCRCWRLIFLLALVPEPLPTLALVPTSLPYQIAARAASCPNQVRQPTPAPHAQCPSRSRCCCHGRSGSRCRCWSRCRIRGLAVPWQRIPSVSP